MVGATQHTSCGMCFTDSNDVHHNMFSIFSIIIILSIIYLIRVLFDATT
eukprot:UN00816